MLKFYFHTGPNPMKVALFLEEAGLDYEVVPVDTRKGEQHAPAFLQINPNAKTPAITDDGIPVFDSNAIHALSWRKDRPVQGRRQSMASRSLPCCPGWMFRRHWHRPLFRPIRPFPSFRRRSRRNTPSTATASRWSATTSCSTPNSPRPRICSATATPSSTWPSGAGPACCPSSSAINPPSTPFPPRQAPA